MLDPAAAVRSPLGAGELTLQPPQPDLLPPGCGAICPAFGRGCYCCFGPAAAPNVAALTAQLRRLGVSDDEVNRVFATFNAASPAYTAARARQ